jgi:zinc D-Ala-D-Ala carboxypeptidase
MTRTSRRSSNGTALSSAEESPCSGNPESKDAAPRTSHFLAREFTCKCDGLCDHSVAISPHIVQKLDIIRDRLGRPLTIVSGTRCERYNRKVGGKEHSAHVPKNGVSFAADIRCPDSAFRFIFLAAALPMFHRIGIGKDFIHVDDDPELPANVMWLY